MLTVQPGPRIGSVTFAGYALVPVVVRRCRCLVFYCIYPGILTGWLIEMPVDAEIFVRHYFLTIPLKYTGKVAKTGAFFYSIFDVRRSMFDVHLFSTAILPLSNASKF